MTFIRHIKETFLLSVPMIVGHLGHMFMGVTDSMMVGRVGPLALAASAVANMMFFVVMVMGLGISMAITPMVAQALGAGRKKYCGVVLRQGLIVNVLSSVVLFVITAGLAYCLQFMNQPEEIVGPATSYMTVLGFSILPMMVFQTYRQFAEGLSHIKAAMIISLAANVINIAANWTFIFGNLGAPALGLTGAGIGTFSSRIFMALLMAAWVLTSKRLKPFEPGLRFKRIDRTIMSRLLAIGIPAGCQYVFEVGAFAGASVMIGWIGAMELAAHQIALNLASISFMFALGVSTAATVRVGTAMGSDNTREVRMAGLSALVLGFLFMSGFAILFIALRHTLPGLYVNSPEVISVAAGILLIAGFFQVSDGVQAIGIGMLRGMMDMNIPTLITLTAYWIIGLPVGYLLGLKLGMGVMGVWMGLLIGLTASGIMLLIRFNRITSKPMF